MNKGFSGKILIVDDEASVRESLMRVMEREGHHVVQAASAEEALSILQQESIHLMLSDLKMPEMNGLELLREVKRHAPETEVVLITGHGTIETAVEAIKEGASDFIAKPFKRAEIIRVLTKALEKRQLVLENKRLREELANTSRHDPFIGKSAVVSEILRLVERVAPLSSTVLITGESGTGKEIIARMLHSKSERQASRFIAVNCGAIAENLIESELFGHVKGSFTGAFRDKDGLFKTADGGTLFLDEISAVPMNLQVKLLRAIEEKEVLPVGATRPITIDARIAAASEELKYAVMDFERAHILKTLEAVGYDKKAAAKFLGTSLSSLYRKLAELNIELASQNPSALSQS